MPNFENDGKKWTWEETLIAFDLYSRIPFSKITGNHDKVKEIATLLKRKPGAVTKKLFNIAAHDPKQISRGIIGLSHSSKLDKEIWDKFEEDSFEISIEAQKALAKAKGVKIDEMIDNDGDSMIVEMFPYGEDRIVATNARIGQYYFRGTVLSAYHHKCCITGISEPKLLVASHIKPWKDSDIRTERVNPRNGLCLNALHDKAFDRGLFTLNDKYEVVFSSQIKEWEMDEETREWFVSYEGKQIALPDKFFPSKELIHYHNDVVFLH